MGSKAALVTIDLDVPWSCTVVKHLALYVLLSIVEDMEDARNPEPK